MYQLFSIKFPSRLYIKTVLFIFCLQYVSDDVFGEETTVQSSKCTYTIIVNPRNASLCPAVVATDQYGAGQERPAVSNIVGKHHHGSFKATIIDETTLVGKNEGLTGSGNDVFHRDLPLKLPLHSTHESRVCHRRLTTLVYRLEHLQQIQRMERERAELYANSVKGHHSQLDNMGTGFEKLESNVSSLIKAVHSIEQKMFHLRKINNNLEHKMASVVLDMDEVHKNIGRRELKIRTGFYDVGEENIPEYSRECSSIARGRENYVDCAALKDAGYEKSGEYFIQPYALTCSVKVWCDMETDGGGWTIFQRRVDGTTNFYRNWTEYRDGFGSVSKEFWLGNSNIFILTNQKQYELRVELWDFKFNHAYAKYRHFKLDGERDKFRLHVSGYTGNARNGFYLHNFAPFSTVDRDHDRHTYKNCAKEWDGGWWFTNCWETYLNGRYHRKSTVRHRGISWNSWKYDQLMRSEMKFRPSR